MKAILLASIIVLGFCRTTFAQATETVLYSFGAFPTDGTTPEGGLLFDSAGNIYGTTNGGGQYCGDDGGCGTVYKLSPNVGGGWTETILYNFCTNGDPFTCPDGANPFAGLIMDKAGNLYGTTSGGGTSEWGTVFRLSPPIGGSGNWTETVLWNFGDGADNGVVPLYGKLTMDAAGNIYGTTGASGGQNFGIVFELSPVGDGTYVFSILQSFQGENGAYPAYGVTIDDAGNLYGTTQLGGSATCTSASCGYGLVYRLSPSNSKWQETILYKFDGVTGEHPVSPISIDQSGDLFGTFEVGGGGTCFFGTCGGIFKLVPEAGGGGKKYTFYFNDSAAGGSPQTGVAIGADDIVYGTIGPFDGDDVYMLQYEKESVLYEFCSLPNCADGYGPSMGTITAREGGLYGVTIEGGEYGSGVVYSLTK
jgi:uncharacterized repeat protein (TIGR03803 family)